MLFRRNVPIKVEEASPTLAECILGGRCSLPSLDLPAAPAVVEGLASSATSSAESLFNASLIVLLGSVGLYKAYQKIQARYATPPPACTGTLRSSKRRALELQAEKAKQEKRVKPAAVLSLQVRFLPVFWLLRLAFWMAGPYFYPVYASKLIDGKPPSALLISRIFLAGFGAIVLFAPLTGRGLDQYGRKRGTLAAVALYAAGALSTKSSSLWLLFAGRALGGVGTNLLSSAPESWLVSEAMNTGADNDGTYLKETFGLAYAFDPLVAIVAGQVAGWCADRSGPTGPFTVMPLFLALAGVIALVCWKENKADALNKTDESPKSSMGKPMPKDETALRKEESAPAFKNVVNHLPRSDTSAPSLDAIGDDGDSESRDGVTPQAVEPGAKLEEVIEKKSFEDETHDEIMESMVRSLKPATTTKDAPESPPMDISNNNIGLNVTGLNYDMVGGGTTAPPKEHGRVDPSKSTIQRIRVMQFSNDINKARVDNSTHLDLADEHKRRRNIDSSTSSIGLDVVTMEALESPSMDISNNTIGLNVTGLNYDMVGGGTTAPPPKKEEEHGHVGRSKSTTERIMESMTRSLKPATTTKDAIDSLLDISTHSIGLNVTGLNYDMVGGGATAPQLKDEEEHGRFDPSKSTIKNITVMRRLSTTIEKADHEEKEGGNSDSSTSFIGDNDIAALRRESRDSLSSLDVEPPGNNGGPIRRRNSAVSFADSLGDSLEDDDLTLDGVEGVVNVPQELKEEKRERRRMPRRGSHLSSAGSMSTALDLVKMPSLNNLNINDMDETPTVRDGLKMISIDKKVLMIGAVQSLFEGSMYIFVMQWPPAMTAAVRKYFGEDEHVPFGTVFSCFMACCMVGSTLFGKLASRKGAKMERIFLYMLIASAVSMAGATYGIYAGFDLFPLILSMFAFEGCVGMYFPLIGFMRSKYLHASHRSVIMTLFSVPLNVLVVTVCLLIHRLGMIGAFGVTTIAMAVASACMARLIAIRRNDAKRHWEEMRKVLRRMSLVTLFTEAAKREDDSSLRCSETSAIRDSLRESISMGRQVA